MDFLLQSRERRIIKRDVARLFIEEIREELEKRACSLQGDALDLRDRHFRALLRDLVPDNEMIPWYPWDDAEVSLDSRGNASTMPPPPRDRVDQRNREPSAGGARVKRVGKR